jgi:hypothetical protein
MSHSCYVGTVDAFFAEHTYLRPLFDALVRFVETIGPFEVEVAKTRITFMIRTRFAGVDRLRRDGLVVHIWLKRTIESPRFSRIDHYPRNDSVYQLIVRSEDDLDDELHGWLEEAYRVGEQRA